MGQFINSDCNTWKASRPSPHCYFTAAHKSSQSSTTVSATTAIKINTAVGNTVVAAALLFKEWEAFRVKRSKSSCIMYTIWYMLHGGRGAHVGCQRSVCKMILDMHCERYKRIIKPLKGIHYHVSLSNCTHMLWLVPTFTVYTDPCLHTYSTYRLQMSKCLYGPGIR